MEIWLEKLLIVYNLFLLLFNTLNCNFSFLFDFGCYISVTEIKNELYVLFILYFRQRTSECISTTRISATCCQSAFNAESISTTACLSSKSTYINLFWYYVLKYFYVNFIIDQFNYNVHIVMQWLWHMLIMKLEHVLFLLLFYYVSVLLAWHFLYYSFLV